MKSVPGELLAAGTALCAFVLIGAGATKLLDLRSFSYQVRAYDLLPPRASRFVGYSLPPAEVLTGVLLVLAPALGAVPAAFLFGLFSAAIATNLVRGRRELVCGCFGPRGRRAISPMHVVVNVLLGSIAASGLLLDPRISLQAVMLASAVAAAVLLASAVTALRVPTGGAAAASAKNE